MCTGVADAACPSDITWDDALCTEWCGLTQGFWKENTLKYLTAKPNGRQVCDEFFTSNAPSAILPSCTSWQCIYDTFNAKGKAKDMTTIQMMALYLTQEYHVSTEGEFYIDCAKFQDECSIALPACNGVEKALIANVWSDLQANPSAGLADCINNYNDAQCSLTVDYPDCEPGTFTGLAPLKVASTSGTAPKKITMRLS
jgi:hypothetical protein